MDGGQPTSTSSCRNWHWHLHWHFHWHCAIGIAIGIGISFIGRAFGFPVSVSVLVLVRKRLPRLPQLLARSVVALSPLQRSHLDQKQLVAPEHTTHLGQPVLVLVGGAGAVDAA
jgi:hypothetical protein